LSGKVKARQCVRRVPGWEMETAMRTRSQTTRNCDKPSAGAWRRGAVWGLVGVCVAGSTCVAARAAALASAEAILDTYVDVTGGKAAYARLKSRVSTGTVHFVSINIQGRFTRYQAASGKEYALVESEALGLLEEGTDGKVAWANSLLAGPRIKVGTESAFVLRDAALDAAVRWREFFTKAEYGGQCVLDGKPCFKLLLTTREGNAETQYYEEKTGLLCRIETVLDSEVGPLPVEITIGDYRETDGVLVPYRIYRKLAGGMLEILTELKRVEHNVAVPPERFKLPTDVQAVVDKEAAARVE
jgi:hypothetical protein